MDYSILSPFIDLKLIKAPVQNVDYVSRHVRWTSKYMRSLTAENALGVASARKLVQMELLSAIV